MARGNSTPLSQRMTMRDNFNELQQAKTIAAALQGVGPEAMNAGFMQRFGTDLGNSLARFSSIGSAMSAAMKGGGDSAVMDNNFMKREAVENRKLKEKLGMGDINAKLGVAGIKAGADRSVAETQFGSSNAQRDLITKFLRMRPDILESQLNPGVAPLMERLAAPPQLQHSPYAEPFAEPEVKKKKSLISDDFKLESWM